MGLDYEVSCFSLVRRTKRATHENDHARDDWVAALLSRERQLAKARLGSIERPSAPEGVAKAVSKLRIGRERAIFKIRELQICS